MRGYVQKDEGKPHYRFWSIGVTEAERRAGVASYQLAGKARVVLLVVRHGVVSHNSPRSGRPQVRLINGRKSSLSAT